MPGADLNSALQMPAKWATATVRRMAAPSSNCCWSTGRQELERCLQFLSHSGMEVAAMEAIQDAEGHLRFYDININTNYNGLLKSGPGAG